MATATIAREVPKELPPDLVTLVLTEAEAEQLLSYCSIDGSPGGFRLANAAIYDVEEALERALSA